MGGKIIEEIFRDESLLKKIQEKLPTLFRIAEIENSRAGKIGMEVGFDRERIITALLIYKFGKENVNVDIPTNEHEIDVVLKGKNLSIKTVTGNGSVKAIWTVDAKSARDFCSLYNPKCDLVLVQIWWGLNKDSFFLIPLDAQKEILREIGYDGYLKMPKPGTNPRGVEFSKEAIHRMISHPRTMKIKINWKQDEIEYNVYKRWVDYWQE